MISNDQINHSVNHLDQTSSNECSQVEGWMVGDTAIMCAACTVSDMNE